MPRASLGRGPDVHGDLVHWSSVGKHTKAGDKSGYANTQGYANINKKLLTMLYLRAALAALTFSAVCTAAAAGVGCGLLHILYKHPQHQPAILASISIALIACEMVFASFWFAKYRRLNRQPELHKPRHPSFNPRHAYSKFVEEQYKTSKWICIKDMLTQWFGGVPLEDIHTGNVADLVTYGFWYMSKDEYEATYGQSAEALVAELEQAWDVKFTSGYNTELSFMAHLWQPIRCHYRPLAFYLAMEVVFVFTRVLMLSMGFQSGTVQGFTYYTYGIRSSDSASQMPKLPILFQHGVGAGLLPYSLFVARMACTGHPVAAMECNHLGMRWTQVKDAEEVVDGMVELLTQHLGWARTCISGHSYGTFYASRLLQLYPHLVDSVCLIDPVTFNMFTGKLIKNFVYDLPNIVTWFIARDIHHATSVCRNFFWSVLCLWPDQLPDRTLVVLSEGDELVPVRETLNMLRHEAPHALVLHHPNHRHADFIADLPWQDAVVSSLVDLLDGRNSPPPHTLHNNAAAGTAALQQAQEEKLEEARLSGGRWLSLLWGPRNDCLLSSDHDLAEVARQAGSDGSGNSAGGDSAYGRSSGARAAVTSTPGKKSGRRKSSSGAAVPKGVEQEEKKKLQQVRSPGGRHGHSDSASSYDSVISRLRPMPHRKQQSIA